MNQFNKRVRTNTGNIFNINYELSDQNTDTGGGGGGGGSGSNIVVVNNLTTNSGTDALSAAQGVVLKTFYNGLSDSVSTLQTNVSSVQASLITLQNTVDTFEDRISTLESEVTANTQDLLQIEAAVNTLDSELITLSNTVTSQQTSITSISNRVTSLESFVNQNVRNTATPTFANITVGSTNLGAALTDVATLNSRVNQAVLTSSSPTFSNITLGSTSLNTVISDVTLLNARVNQALTMTASPTFARIRLGTSTDADVSRFISALDSSMPANSDRFFIIGRSNNAGNQSEIGFRWVGDASGSNEIYFGFHSFKAFSVFYDGRVRVAGSLVLVNNTSSALAVTGSMNWNSSTSVPRFHNGTTWNDVATQAGLNTTNTNVTNLQSSLASTNSNVTALQSTVNSLTNSDLKTQIYGVYSFTLTKDNSGSVILQTFTQRGTTLFTNPTAPGGVLAPGLPIYFSNNGSFEWGSNMEIIPMLMYFNNDIGSNQIVYVPGVTLVQEDNQTFSIRPYQGTSISDWHTVLRNNSGIGFRFILQRIQF